MDKRRKIIYPLLFWLITVSSFNAFAEALNDVPQALTLTSDTVINGTLSVSSFHVSEETVALVDQDLVVSSQGDIIIDGSIIGIEGNLTSTLSQALSNQTDAASITLTTPGKIIINGTIQAANGIDGQNGGNIFLNAKEIVLNNHLTAGNGGHGSGYGMDGGDGGSIFIDGTLVTPDNETPVNVQAGNGGDGSESLPDKDGSNGGNGGDVILGDGSNGGPGVPGNNDTGSNGTDGSGGGRCANAGHGGPGANVIAGVGGNGNNHGGNASILSGRGGNGGHGGKGGNALGGNGGYGGKGGDCCNPDGPGGNGGHGAQGGNATGGRGGNGGKGGNGVLFGNGGEGGKGGDGGTGTGGNGGNGGDGGVGVPGGAAGLAAIGGTGTAGAGGLGGAGGNGGLLGNNGAPGAFGVPGGAVSGSTGAGGAPGGLCPHCIPKDKGHAVDNNTGDIQDDDICPPGGFIDLTEFKALTAENGTLSLTWTTGTEIDNLGMNLWCAQLQDNQFKEITKLNSQLIPSKAILPNYGASYSSEDYPWIDTNLKPGIQHCTLEDFDANGQCTLHCDEMSTVVIGNGNNISATELNELNAKAIVFCNEYKPDGVCLEQLLAPNQ